MRERYSVSGWLLLVLLAGATGICSPTAAQTLQPGPFGVGFRVIEAVDHSRTTGPKRDYTGALQPDAAALVIPISVWYPAEPGTGEPILYGTYLALDRTHKRGSFGPVTDADRADATDWLNRLARYGLEEPLTDEQRDDIFRRPATARQKADPAAGRFPLLLGGLYGTQAANMLAEYLASHGYVVATSPMRPEVTSQQFQATQLAIETQSRTLEFVFAQVRALPFVDASRLGLLGVSFEGFSVLNVQMRNMRADAVASLDGWEGTVQVGDRITESPYFDPVRLRVPYLLFAQADPREQPQFEPNLALFETLRYADRAFYVVEGVSHPYYIGDLLAWPHLEEQVRPAYAFIYGSVRRFFDAHVKGDAEARAWLARSPAENGFHDLAFVVERRAEALPPVPTREAFAALVETDPERAERVLREARVANPDVELVSMQTLHQLAFRAVQREAWSEAVAVNRVATSAFPASTQAYYALGNTLRRAGREEEAISAYRQALRALPGDPDIAEGEREESRRQIQEQLDQLETP